MFYYFFQPKKCGGKPPPFEQKFETQSNRAGKLPPPRWGRAGVGVQTATFHPPPRPLPSREGGESVPKSFMLIRGSICSLRCFSLLLRCSVLVHLAFVSQTAVTFR